MADDRMALLETREHRVAGRVANGPARAIGHGPRIDVSVAAPAWPPTRPDPVDLVLRRLIDLGRAEVAVAAGSERTPVEE
jgi:hypothetical protein